MNEKLTEELIKRFDVIAAKLGVTADALWAALMKQAMFAFIGDMITIVIVCVGWVFFARWMIPLARKNDDLGTYTLAVVWGIMLVIFTCSIMFSIDSIISEIANPEYWALQKLISMIPRSP